MLYMSLYMQSLPSRLKQRAIEMIYRVFEPLINITITNRILTFYENLVRNGEIKQLPTPRPPAN